MRSTFALFTASTAILLGASYAFGQTGTPSRAQTLEQRLQSVEAELKALRQQQSQAVPPWAGPVRLPEPEEDLSYYNDASYYNDGSAITQYEMIQPGYRMPAPSAPSTNFPTATLSGFFQADAGLFYQSPLNITTVGDIQDGADFRRARLLAKGDVYNNVGYMVEMDFAFPGHPSFMDVYMEGRQIPLLGTFRLGQWRQPWGMDELTSVRELTFLERGLPFAFAPFRQIGLGIMNHDPTESITWAASLIRFPTNVFGSNIGDNGGYSMTSRFTVLPWYVENYQVFHLGFDYAYIDPANNAVQYRNQPEFFVGETGGGAVPMGVPTQVPFFVDTGVINTVTSQLYGVEIAGSWGPVYAQSEVQYAMVNQINGPMLKFPGAYAQLGWFLTGESRAYNRKNAVFTRVQPLRNFGFGPQNGLGAWELAFRWSHLDLNDNNIQGGRLNDLTLGLNWYLNRYTKLQFNNIHAFLNNPTYGPSECNIVATRAQIDF
jgi:phosphate-selective porin OprO/OprP